MHFSVELHKMYLVQVLIQYIFLITVAIRIANVNYICIWYTYTVCKMVNRK